MNHVTAILELIMGVGALFVGLTAKGKFYALGPGQHPTAQTKIIPTWLGRLWFSGCGCVLLYWAIPALKGAWHWQDLGDGILLSAFAGCFWLLIHYLKRRSHPKSDIQILSPPQDY